MRKEQDVRSDLFERFRSDKVASQSVISVFDNLVTLLDDYRIVRQSFTNNTPATNVRSNTLLIDRETSQCPTVSFETERFRSHSIILVDGSEASTITSKPGLDSAPHMGCTTNKTKVVQERRTTKRPRKGTPSYLGCIGTLPQSADNPGGHHSCGESLNAGHNYSNTFHTTLDGVQQEFAEENYRSIYSDISESVLSDPQVLQIVSLHGTVLLTWYAGF